MSHEIRFVEGLVAVDCEKSEKIVFDILDILDGESLEELQEIRKIIHYHLKVKAGLDTPDRNFVSVLSCDFEI